MAARGHNRAKPDAIKRASGTARKDRKTVSVVPDAPVTVPLPPPGLSLLAQRIWQQKVLAYRARGQSIAGCEGPLRVYVEIEEDLITMRREGKPIPVALLNAYRLWANEFYDTPGSQNIDLTRATTTQNRFAGNGTKPNGA